MKNLIVEKLNCHLGSAIEIDGNFLQPSIAQNIIIKKNEEKNKIISSKERALHKR